MKKIIGSFIFFTATLAFASSEEHRLHIQCYSGGSLVKDASYGSGGDPYTLTKPEKSDGFFVVEYTVDGDGWTQNSTALYPANSCFVTEDIVTRP